MDLTDYYAGNPEEAFWVNSFNLLSKSDILNLLDKYDFLSVTDEESKKRLHDFRVYVCDNLDEFNFLFVRIATALELSIKGVALHKKFNIFEQKFNNLRKFDSLEMNENKLRTLPFSFFIRNMRQLFTKDVCDKYNDMFEFFKNMRNDYIHFSRKRYVVPNRVIMKNFLLLKDYYIEVSLPLKDRNPENIVLEA